MSEASSGKCTRISLLLMRATSSDIVQPQLGDVLRILLQLAAFDALDDVGQNRVGAAVHAELLALAHDMAVDELDLGAPALGHVLAHRGALLGRGLLAVGEALRIIGLDR